MKIHFHGQHTTEEAAESLLSILRLFSDRYGIADFRELELDMVLLNIDGEDVELVDANTSDILDSFEVYPSELDEVAQDSRPALKLVVDNTKLPKL